MLQLFSVHAGSGNLDPEVVWAKLAALAENRETLVALFRDAIAEKRGRVPGMPKRTAMMMAYLMQHDAHHRGQVTRQLSEFGYQLSGEATSRIWGWRKLDR